MAQFHFVEDYQRHVAALLAAHPLDEAMALAVGGGFDRFGQIEMALLVQAGLRAGMSLFDLGCGSGRLAVALSNSALHLHYHGTDVVQALLDYAASRSRPGFRFQLHPALTIPRADESVDIACAFSVFTHLLHHESYIYLEEMKRVLRPGGRVVFSFLEFAEPRHWKFFQHAVAAQRNSEQPVLCQFMERQVVANWAAALGLELERFVDGREDTGAGPLGQTAVVLRKP